MVQNNQEVHLLIELSEFVSCREFCIADRIRPVHLSVVSHFPRYFDLKLYHMLVRLPLPADIA
jgi:hypothetical protein